MSYLIADSSMFTLPVKNLVDRSNEHFNIVDYGFLSLTTTETCEQTWYPTPSDIVESGWYDLDIHGSNFGDFNGDGLTDLLLQPMLFTHVLPRDTVIAPLFLLQTEDGGFSNPASVASSSAFPDKHFLYRIGVGDFDGDGANDAFLSAMSEPALRTEEAAYGQPTEPVVIFGNEQSIEFEWTDSYQGLSVYSEPPLSDEYELGYKTGHDASVGDFNGDGLDDWFSGWYIGISSGNRTFATSVLSPHPNSSFSFDSQFTYPNVNASAAGDMNNDGFDDLIFSAMPFGDLYIAFGSIDGLRDGDEILQIDREINSLNPNVGTNFIQINDFTGDGYLDIILMEHGWTTESGDSSDYYSSGRLRLFENIDGFRFEENSAAIIDPYSGARHGEGNLHSLDLNGDGWSDLVLTGYQYQPDNVWGAESYNRTSIFLNNNGVLEMLPSEDIPYLNVHEDSPERERGPEKMYPVDIGNDGLIDFVSFVQTPLSQWPQVEQNYWHGYILEAKKPLGREIDETLHGTKNSDLIFGYNGNDLFIGSLGEDLFDGGAGIDTAQYDEAKSTVTKNGSFWTVFGDQLTGIERLEFSDTDLALDLDGSAGLTAKTLAAVIGEDGLSNKEYVGIGLQLFDAGQSLAAVCERALTAVGATTNEEVVNLLYANLYGEAPTAQVAQPFIDALNKGEYSKGVLASAAAELTDDLGVIDLVGLAETGIEYI